MTRFFFLLSHNIRWFHFTCLPVATTSIADEAGRVALGLVDGQWFHCSSCSVIRGKLRQAAIGMAESRATAKENRSEGTTIAPPASSKPALVTVSLLDLGDIRESRSVISRRDPARAKPAAGKSDHEVDRVHGLLCGASAMRDLSAVARIFSQAYPSPDHGSALEEVCYHVSPFRYLSRCIEAPVDVYQESIGQAYVYNSPCTEETSLYGFVIIHQIIVHYLMVNFLNHSFLIYMQVLEADYALLARDAKSGKPVAAASLLVFGSQSSQGKQTTQGITLAQGVFTYNLACV